MSERLLMAFSEGGLYWAILGLRLMAACIKFRAFVPIVAEYDSIMDKLASCAYDGSPRPLCLAKAVQANLMAMVATEAIAEAWPAERPFVVSRSGFAGIQRYAQTWSGDNLTSWRTLKYNVDTILGVSALLLQPKSLFAISLFAVGIGLCCRDRALRSRAPRLRHRRVLGASPYC